MSLCLVAGNDEDIDPDLKRLLEKRKAAEGAGIPDPENQKRDHNPEEDPSVDPDWKRFSAIRRESEGKDFDESQYLKQFQEKGQCTPWVYAPVTGLVLLCFSLTGFAGPVQLGKLNMSMIKKMTWILISYLLMSIILHACYLQFWPI